MLRRTHTLGRRLVLGALVGALGLLTWGTDAWASVRLAPDIELQAWYRMRHSFQTDGSEHFDWVQWRNEGFIWLTYDNFYYRGKWFGKFEIPVPMVQSASLSARYRSRVDPVYVIRDHYKNLYDEEHTSNWLVPENGFRDIYVDLDHGHVGPGRLSTRWGYQQVVWGESDLFRSIDIVNPLRIDQNLGVGEKFDEFRSPILALKALYDIGNIGTWISGFGIEGYYTPRFRGGQTDLLVEDGWRIQQQIRGCEKDGVYYDWSLHDCGTVGSDGTGIRMLPYRPVWVGKRRSDHPWAFNATGNNAAANAVDFLCETGARCAADVPGDRVSARVNLPKGNSHHHSRGHWHSGGVRLVGSTWFNLDFSLNYMYIPYTFANGNTVTDFSQYGPDLDGDGFIDGTVGDDGEGIVPDGSFREGLLRCVSPSGKEQVAGNGRTNGGTFIRLHGTDLSGYNWKERHLDENGAPTDQAKQAHAIRKNYTYCTNGFSHQRRYTNVIGFTLTYNDFDYTGAVFRFEQSYSTKEALNKRTYTNNREALDSGQRARRRGRILNSAGVWRSMFGFDLIQALMNYPGMGWTRHLPGQFGVQTSFLTGQWLMLYNNTGRSGVTGNMCNWNTAQGLPTSVAEPDPALRTQGDGKYDPANPDDPLAPKRDAVRGCHTKRWNHLFTLAFAGNGYFRGKLEGRNAVAWEPKGSHVLLFSQWWWRELKSMPLDLSFGTAWFLGSYNSHSWTTLNYFAQRDMVWFEATYYII